MKKTDYQLIGYIGVVLGAIFLVGGLFASIYYETRQGLIWAYKLYPYAQYSGSLLVVGIVLLVIGLAFLWRAKQEGAPTQATLPKPPD